MNVPAPVRVVGWSVGDLASALIGATALESELGHIFPTHSRADLITKHDLLSAVAALVIGYAAWTLRPHESAKWLWIGGLVWVGQRILVFWHQSRMLRVVGASHSVYWEMSGQGCQSGFTPSCDSWLFYTIMATNMICYSAGAWCAASPWLGWRGIRERWRAAPQREEADIDPGE